MTTTYATAGQNVPVYLSNAIMATDGANMGDPISFARELVLDDIYEVTYGATAARLSLTVPDADGLVFRISADTDIGIPGADLHLDSALTFMSPDGQMSEALLLVEVDGSGNAREIYMLPLSTLSAGVEYRLVGIDTDTPRQKFAHVACVSFTRGTHITMASGEQRPIEHLSVGDRILTRDDGVQELRWIGLSTVRAVGDFAPVCIGAGTLNNDHDLIVSPDHRLFIYQRTDELGAGRSELLIKARHLVNADSITVQGGGFVDYFQLLFDGHQIIYAEGIAAESMLIDSRTSPVLPAAMTKMLDDLIPGHARLPHAGMDVSKHLLSRPDTAALLRKASTR